MPKAKATTNPKTKRNAAVPVIYRYICPDGRSYVGHANADYARNRSDGLRRVNARLSKAFVTHPAQTWTYEVLEELPVGCSKRFMLAAEQRHIDRLRTHLPEYGFN